MSEFGVCRKNLDGLYNWCKPCRKAHDATKWKTDANRRGYIQHNRDKQRKLLREFIIDYLSTHPCVDCGERDLVVLDFDHVRGSKVGDISSMIRGGWSLETVQAEVAKCEVRCANCHRRVTAARGGWFRLDAEAQR